MTAIETLNRYRRLLNRHLRPEWPRLCVLAAILCGSIAVQVVTPILASRFVDRASSSGPQRALALLALLSIGLAVVGQGAAIAETYLAESVSWTATNALRSDLLAHLLRLDATFHSSYTPGELIERVDGDVGNLSRFFSRFVVYVLGNGLLIVGVLAFLVHVDARIGLMLTAFVALALFAMLRIRAASKELFVAERRASADFYGSLGEYLSGLEDVRSSGAGAFVLRHFAQETRAWLAATLRAQMRGYALIAVSLGSFGVGAAVALAMSAVLYRDGALTIGAVYLIFQYTDVLRRPTEQLRNEVQDLQQADASISRIEALLATTSKLVDGSGVALPPGPLAVELDGVSFGYGDGAPVLRDISMRVEPGRVLGVIGRTGSGKTTLTRLIPRFYDPLDGSVSLGGVDVRSVPVAAVRSRIAIVSQEVNLFNASVRDNVTLFDDGVSDERVVAALDTLGLGAWLREQPLGLRARLGPGAVGLSAGQAQALACARIFLQDPDIVILDEASSRLDPATERSIHAALGQLLNDRTGIIVAHRLATMAYADDIAVLNDGRLVEHGPRVELAANPNSHFASLLRAAEEVSS